MCPTRTFSFSNDLRVQHRTCPGRIIICILTTTETIERKTSSPLYQTCFYGVLCRGVLRVQGGVRLSYKSIGAFERPCSVSSSELTGSRFPSA